MSDLLLLPDIDVEQLVKDFLLDQFEVTDYFDSAVDSTGTAIATPRTDRVYTIRPGLTRAQWPLVLVRQFTDRPVRAHPAWLTQSFLQIDVEAGPAKLARDLAGTCRRVLEARLPGIHGDAVVTSATTQGGQPRPDPETGRAAFLFVLTVTAHPNPNFLGS